MRGTPEIAGVPLRKGEGVSVPPGSVRPYFFLSYARTPKRDPSDRDDPDRWVHKLYRDLCAEILQLTDARPGEAGFMDRENQLGAAWSPELMSALANCRVFLPLYSRRYFESESCGREWFAFARREINQLARERKPVHTIVPALWTRMSRENIPEIARHIQYDHAGLGPRYLAEGFYGIMKLSCFRSDYQRAVHRLAERIIEVADEAGIEPRQEEPLPDFESLQSAFGPTSARRTSDGRLQIAILAHDISTVPPGRSREYYGSAPQTWTPYQPEFQQPLAEYTTELAVKCLDCEPIVTVLQDRISGWRATRRPPPPSICLVDAWVATSPNHQKWLRRLDEMEESWVSVLIPWSRQDAELAKAHELKERVEQLLSRRLAGVPWQCRQASTGIPTLPEFGQILPQMTMIMLKRFHKNAPAYPPPGPEIRRPRLRDLGSDNSEGKS
jgi:FxsC-like protein